MKLDKVFHTAVKKDPRFSSKQRQTLAACLAQDPKAEIMGIDKKGRPVVEVEVGIPRQKRMWAITRAGEPAEIAWEDKEGPQVAENIAEPWDDGRG